MTLSISRLSSVSAMACLMLLVSCSPAEISSDSERSHDQSVIEDVTTEPAKLIEGLAVGPTLSELEFGGSDLLFAASNDNQTIYAFAIDESISGVAPEQPTPFNFEDFGTRISDFLGVQPFDILYRDLAVHPVSSAAFLSVSVKTEAGTVPALVRVSQDGSMTLIETKTLASSSIELSDPANPDIVFWRDVPAASLTVTDLEFDDGELLVAGLSTGEFASTLRKIQYPFDGAIGSTSIEIFHAAHNQNETRAPIRAMTIASVNGEKTLIAAYTCTPLVTIPTSSLDDGAHVTGKTVAELGYGNVPVEVLPVSAMNMRTQQPEDFILVINREMSANLVLMEDLAATTNAPGITQPIQGLGDVMGVKSSRHPLGGVVQADIQDAQFLLVLKRNIDTGEMELVSQLKGSYFRLSDFVSEYNFPDYVYAENQAMTEMFHNMVKPMEGYPELVSN